MFLKNETDYYPWYSAIKGFNSLTKLFGETTEIGKSLKTFQLELLQTVNKSVPVDTLKPEDQIYTLKQVKILEQMCKLGEESCILSAKDLFAKAKANKRYDSIYLEG